MSTYSTNLALELIGTGDQAGVWGTTTNTNLGTLIEQAISGYVTQAVVSGTDTTITIPNGAYGVARNMYIELTGTGGAGTNLIVPANKKLYYIYNNTTGSVTVKVSGQTGVTVPAAAKISLVCDGTDIVSATNYMQTLVLNNPVPIISGGTGQSTANAAFNALAPSQSAQSGKYLKTDGTNTSWDAIDISTADITGILPVLNGGTGVTTSTGTGSNVLSTNPTLTTPNLGTPSVLTLTNATGLPLTSGVTGTLPIGNGGTGVTTTPTDGQLLIGNGTGFSLATITGSTNVTVTNSPGGITISATPGAGGVSSFSGGTTGLTPSSPTTGGITLGGTLAVANGGTGVTTSTGSGSNVLSTSPTLITPNLGTPASATLTNATGLPLSTGVTGTLPVANGGTGLTTAPTNGQIDIGSTGVGFVRTTLTAGSGVSITNGAGAITIAATGSGGTVTSVGGTGSVNGITLSGTVTSSGSLTLGGTLSGVSLSSQVTGTLPVANGGTGLTTTPSNGALDIGNGTGFTRTTLTAGSGISITNGAGAITIANSGVTSVGGTGSVNGITLSGTVTSTGSLTLGGSLSGVSLTSQVSGTLPVANGGTGVTTSTGSGANVLGTSPTISSPTITGTPTVSASLINRATEVNTTSGTAIDFTGIPSWVKRITVMFSGVSTNSNSQLIVQTGTASSFVTSGYVGGYGAVATSPSNPDGFAITSGLAVGGAGNAGDTINGSIVITNLASNTWVMQGCVYRDSTVLINIQYSAGSIAVGAALTRIRITTVNGTDTFDAGTVNIIYE